MRQVLGAGALGRPRGIGMGNTCISMADSCQCMTKTTKYCKVISLQLIKINGKFKKKYGTNQSIYETETESWKQKIDWWLPKGSRLKRDGVGGWGEQI